MAHLGFSDTYGSSSVAVKALFSRGERDLGSFVVVQVTDEGSPLFREVVNVLSRSECGSFETAPDPLLDWGYAPRTGDVFNPLPESPSKERLAWFRWLMEYLSHFVDEQRLGPYQFWYHEHRFNEVKEGTLATDTVTYSIPFGPLGGDIIHALAIRPKLQSIFSYRQLRINQLFNEG